MKKLLHIAASIALLGGVLLVAPQAAKAASKYNIWVSQTANSYTGSTGGTNCKAADYDNLSDALDNAQSGWTIYLCNGTYSPSDDGDTYYEIEDDFITIVGASRTTVRIDGKSGDEGIFYSNGYDLALKNLTVTNGTEYSADYGHGGAVSLDNGGDFYCDNVAFSNNWANTSGGAVYADYVSMKKCTFTNNSSGGILGMDPSTGGAIDATYMDDSGSTFTGNSLIFCGVGGAVYLSDGGTFIGSVFTGNKAGIIWECPNAGGAIFAYQEYGSDLVLRGVKFTGNEAIFGGAVLADDNSGDTAVRITKSTFTENRGWVLGGAIDASGALYDNGSTFASNSSTEGEGDAIWVDEFISLSATKFLSNSGSNVTVYLDSCDEADHIFKKVKWGAGQAWDWNECL